MEKPTVEELSVQDAVRVWGIFDERHSGHKGKWRDFDKTDDVLRLGCAQCGPDASKVINVYVERPQEGTLARDGVVTF